MRWIHVFAFALAGVLCSRLTTPACGASYSLAGTWKGTWTKNGDPLPVTLSFEDTNGVYTGSFDSDALQVTGIPFSSITVRDGDVRWILKGDQTTAVFTGTLAGDLIEGTFDDGGVKGNFALTRAPLFALSVANRNVTFADDGITLSGTLLLPRGSGKHPAVLFLQGSGPEGRWANHYLALQFAQRGFVALIYDKRGVGRSGGDWRSAVFDALADDAVAGIRYLQSRNDVDRSSVGIYGHSQGGTIAPLVAVRAGDLAFVIASAAGGIAPAEMEIYSVENSIDITGLSSGDRADAELYVKTLVDVAYHGSNRAALDALSARFKDRSWYFAPPPSSSSYWAIAHQIAGFDPAEYWQRVTGPVLLLYGAHDERVPPIASADAIEAALAAGNNDRVTLKVYPTADHTFTIVEPSQTGWPKHVPDYASFMIDWALAQLKLRETP
jgi:uncharacterized protein